MSTWQATQPVPQGRPATCVIPLQTSTHQQLEQQRQLWLQARHHGRPKERKGREELLPQHACQLIVQPGSIQLAGPHNVHIRSTAHSCCMLQPPAGTVGLAESVAAAVAAGKAALAVSPEAHV